MMGSSPTSTCRLCRKETELCDSHILPAFAFRWLKRRSGKGHIRDTDNINRRVQDGLKLKWLCKDCEELFNRSETQFAKSAFHPWTSKKKQILYDDWMLKFCVSVSWRVLTYAYGRNPEQTYSENHKHHLVLAEERWRNFLLGKTKDLGRYQQHLILFDLIDETTIPDLPTNFNRYMAGSITLDIVGSQKAVMTYAKIGPFNIFGMILKGGGVWRGTKVKQRKGWLLNSKVELPMGLLDLFKEKAEIQQRAHDRLSPDQRRKIDDHVLSNLEIFGQSEQFDAMLADARMFGIAAVTSKP